uniref:Serine carboxypeptidase n=1 Tax=Rhipicephalus zambeziensis TaxID=60191 RepID=A0A224Z0W1_9ACAR
MVRENSFFFYVLMKARTDPSNAPLIIWLQGGPGRSGMFGQFLENGPVGINANGELFNRSSTFVNFANVLYVDYPAGGGLSIILTKSVLSTSLDNVTDDLLNFLKKFYGLYPEYFNRPLYLAGESYGARTAVALSVRMQKECENRPVGVMLFAGFLIPLGESILKSQEFLYQLSMVDEKGRSELAQMFAYIQTKAKNNTTEAAILLAATVFNLKLGGRKSLFANLTGYDDQESVLHATKDPEVEQYMTYVNNSHFKGQLGIPKPEMVSLEGYRSAINFMLAPGDYFTSIDSMFQDVLQSQRVLILNGQMDDIFPPVLFEEYFSKMTWNGSELCKQTPRMPWKTPGSLYGLSGYIKECGNLTTAVALQAGHYVGFHASEPVYDAVKRFVNGLKYSDDKEKDIK